MEAKDFKPTVKAPIVKHHHRTANPEGIRPQAVAESTSDILAKIKARRDQVLQQGAASSMISATEPQRRRSRSRSRSPTNLANQADERREKK